MQALGPKEINAKTVRHSALCQLILSYVIYNLFYSYRLKYKYHRHRQLCAKIKKLKIPWGAKRVNKNTAIVFYVKVNLI